MRAVRSGLGLQIGHAAITLGYGLSLASTVVAGGLLLAMLLVG